MNGSSTRTSTKRIAALAAPALALVTLGLGAPAAHAAGTPTLSVETCQGDGRGTWECDVDVSGGTAPYTFQWAGVQDAWVTSVDSSPTNTYAFGYCNINRGGRISLTVTDSAGAVVTRYLNFFCYDIPPVPAD